MTLAKDAKLKIGGRVYTLCAERYAPSAESQEPSRKQSAERYAPIAGGRKQIAASKELRVQSQNFGL